MIKTLSMFSKIFILFILIYSVNAAGRLPDRMNISQTFSTQLSLQDDSTFQDISFQGIKANSLKSDFIRSAAGAVIGTLAGAGIVGYLPALMNRDYESRSFPDNSFYLRSYVGAGSLAALSSATVLYFSKNRKISYWKMASYSIIPPMILVMPLSVYASVNERDELVRSTWIATVVSIGISTMWSVLVYRIHPVKDNELVSVSFGKPYLTYRKQVDINNPGLTIGIKIIELQF